jgi:hypothetical protein
MISAPAKSSGLSADTRDNSGAANLLKKMQDVATVSIKTG